MAASDKLVSLFEPHADIIHKGREVAYGHKLNLTTGPRGLILDLVVEAGNPADSERLLPMLERHGVLYGQPPRQAAADGSYASRDNLRRAKTSGVRDMAFHKKGGLAIEDMVSPENSVRPDGAVHQRKDPPRELSIGLVADERPGRVTGGAEAS